MKHPSEHKPRPDNVEELRSLSSVKAASATLNSPPKTKTAAEVGPKYHNPYKGMKI